MPIHIVTDTDANLPDSVLDEYDISTVPIHIIFQSEVLRERIDVTDSEAFRRIEMVKDMSHW